MSEHKLTAARIEAFRQRDLLIDSIRMSLASILSMPDTLDTVGDCLDSIVVSAKHAEYINDDLQSNNLERYSK